MNRFHLRLAGLTVAAECRYPQTKDFCAEYLTSDSTEADISVRTTPEKIALDAEMLGNATPQDAEASTLLREIAEHLPEFDRLVWHGAAIEYGGRAYLFLAPSGVGKSTHLSLWRRYLGERVQVINGDKPILHIASEGIFVSGTPWSGKEGWQSPRTVSLAALCLLHRGTEDRIVSADAEACLDELLAQVYLPHELSALDRTLSLTERLLKTLPLYCLDCTISEDAVRASFEAMTGASFEKGECLIHEG